MACYPRIRELRKSCGLTQKRLAEHLGIHRTSYNRYERGIRGVPPSVLYDLAVFYNISSNYIIGLTNAPRPLKPNKKR